MRDAWPVFLFFGVMYVLQRWVLPRLGVQT
jgi:hypothetical protein